MATEREVKSALKILGDLQRMAGQRHCRIHQPAMEDRADRIRCLEGACGQCKSLHIQILKPWSLKKEVKLVCWQRCHPTTLSKEIPLGEEIQCAKFEKRDENSR